MRMRGSSLRFARELLACGTLLAALRLSGEDMDLPRARLALAAAPIPAEAKAAIQARVDASPNVFLRYVSAASSEAAADLMLLARVDKEKALPKAYAPADLVALDGTGLSVSRAGHHLRKPAYIALKAMDAAARLDGTNLVVASSYRSYDYQVEVWNRTVKSDGLAATEASVAPPGHSQHQLGTAVDFGPISEAFAQTKASSWLATNARRFGFSLSYPKGLTAITGYEWESWHYRYIGKEAAALEGEFFGGIQEYVLLFLERL